MRPSIRKSSSWHQFFQKTRQSILNESIYSRLCFHYSARFLYLHDDDTPEISLSSPLFGIWKPEWRGAVAQLLDTDRVEIDQLRGNDIGGPFPLATDLRYCRRCMLTGYHSIVFQHRALFHCPWHGDALLEVCLFCKKPIIPTLRGVLYDPYMCHQCGWPLSSCLTQHQNLDALHNVGSALTAIRQTLARAKVESVKFLPSDRYWSNLHPAVLARQMQRVMLFDQPINHLPCWIFPSEHYKMRVFSTAADDEQRNERALINDLNPLLRWLSENCPGADDACELTYLVGMQTSGIRLNKNLSLLGVALYRTLLRFGLVKAFRHVHESSSNYVPDQEEDIYAPIRTSATIWGNKEIDVKIIQLEILSLFSVLIAGARPDSPLVQIDWRAHPDGLSFAPGIAIRKIKNESHVLVRGRANEKTVIRLFRRYVKARHISIPE